jgi:hypothetical protein
MTKLLEVREHVRTIYGKYEIYIKSASRFILGWVVFQAINRYLGYMERLNHPVIPLLLALVCTFFPANLISILSVLMILLHLFSLSLEVCVVGLLLFLVMFFIYYKFAPDNGYNVALTPLLFYFKIPHLMPVSIGLLKEPYAIFSMVCGIITFYFLRGVHNSEGALNAADDEAVSKFSVVLQQVVNNQEMYWILLSFVLTAILVYIIRRLSVNYSWTIAICVGCALNLIILLVGTYVMNQTGKVLSIVLSSLISLIVAFLLEFLFYNLDYTRIERVQFEDDEYYYFVKAVPKVFVSVKEKKVQQINPKKRETINKRDLAKELDIDQDLLDD